MRSTKHYSGACAPRECNSQASAPPRPALLARAPGAALLAKGSKPVCVGCPHLPPARCGAASSKSTMNHGPSRSAWSRGWQSSHDGAQERRTETKRSFAKCVAWCVVVMVATKEMSDPSVTRTRHITPGTQQTWGVPHPGVCATSPCPCGKGPRLCTCV